MKPILAVYNPKMYNYTKNIYKAVKCTLKTQIKVFCKQTTNAPEPPEPPEPPKAIIVYYLCGAVVYGCTTPLIHLTKGYGCLSKKFFIFFKFGIIGICISLSEKFFSKNFL